MWTATLDLSPRRVLLTQLLGRFWRGAYLSSFAPLRVENMPRQQLQGAQWVRVRNRLAGICGSDLHLITVDGDLRVAPAALPGHSHSYLGHEVVGEVIEVGDEVEQLQVGDRVVLQHGVNCISAGVTPPCRSCASGNYTLCEHGTFSGPQPIGGGWSEEMLLHEQQLFRVPPEMSDEQAVLLEPTSVALHAVLRHVPQAGERVLIIGAGTIGLLTLQVVRALSPDAEISVLARYPFQVEKATRMGASHIIYPQDSYREVQRVTKSHLYEGMFGNRMLLGGYDTIYDTIGNRGTIHNALRWTRAKGTVVLVGVSLHFMNIDLSPVWYQEINLIGTMGQGMETWPLSSHKQRSTFDIASDLIVQAHLRPEQLITHHFALSNYRVALQTAMDKRQVRAIKVVFDYSMQPASVVPNVRASARIAHPTTPFTPPSPVPDVTTAEPEPVTSQQTRSPLPPVAEPLPPTPVPFTSAPAPVSNLDLTAPVTVDESIDTASYTAPDSVDTHDDTPLASSEPVTAGETAEAEEATESEEMPLASPEPVYYSYYDAEESIQDEEFEQPVQDMMYDEDYAISLENGDDHFDDSDTYVHIDAIDEELIPDTTGETGESAEEATFSEISHSVPLENEETFSSQRTLHSVELAELNDTPRMKEQSLSTAKREANKDKLRSSHSNHTKRRKKTHYLVTPEQRVHEDTTYNNVSGNGHGA